MFPTEPSKIVITGLHLPAGVAYKLADGTLITAEGQVAAGVLTSTGDIVEPTIYAVTSKTPRTFAYSVTTLSGTSHMSGSVVPVTADVKLSVYTDPNDHWGEELEANLIADIQTNEYGEFSMSFSGRNERVVVWCEVPSTLMSLDYGIQLSISYERLGEDSGSSPDSGNTGGGNTSGDSKPSGPYLVQTAYQCGDYISDGATYAPTFTVYGYCPEDTSQVFISAQPTNIAEGTDIVTALEDNILHSAVADAGNYSVSFPEPIPTRDIIVWCISEINGYISVEYTVDQGSFGAVCLAGDTPILLYDGTSKALRDLTADDVLMAGDHTPTRITEITRGIISDYHTLYLFDDSTVIDEAHRHRFFNVDAGFWMYLDEWKIGDHAKKCDGTTPKLIRIERVDEPCRRYGLWTESHDYYAGNLLSGETAANQTVLANATIEQAADMMATLDAHKLDRLYKGVL